MFIKFLDKNNYMKGFGLLIIFSLISTCMYCQNFSWAKVIGGSNYDEGNKTVLDVAGNIYSTGKFQGTVDFDPGIGTFYLTSDQSTGIFVLKLNASGNFKWARKVYDGQAASANFISLDSSGNVYTTGEFNSTSDFDPGKGIFKLTSVGESDIFISKLDMNGNFKWAKSIGGSNFDYSNSCVIEHSGNILITGSYIDSIDFNPGNDIFTLPGSKYNQHGFVLKLNAMGDFIWAKQLGGEGRSINIGTSGSICVAGSFRGSVDFDPGIGKIYLTSSGRSDIFILKLDKNGNFIWVRKFGGTGSDFVNYLIPDKMENIIFTGRFEGKANFDAGKGIENLTSAGGMDIFISKLDVGGNLSWAKSMGGKGWDESYSLTLDDSGNIYATGIFDSLADFNRGGIPYYLASYATDLNIYFLKLDKLGALEWVKQFDGKGGAFGHSIIVDPLDNIYITGSFGGQIDFDSGPGIFSFDSKGADIFIVKYGNCDLRIETQPFSQTINVGANVQYTVLASNPLATYQWQQNSGKDFMNLLDTGQYSGVKNDTLNITAVSLSQNNYHYRCLVDIDSCFEISIADKLTVKENEIKDYIIIFPNPSTGTITIKSKNIPIDLPYDLIDAIGRKIIVGKLNSNLTIIDISSLAQGFYFLQIGGVNREIFKIVKQ